MSAEKFVDSKTDSVEVVNPCEKNDVTNNEETKNNEQILVSSTLDESSYTTSPTISTDEDKLSSSDKILEIKQDSKLELVTSLPSIEDDDPIPSGTGLVSKDCSPAELIGWSDVLCKWHAKLDKRPKGLDALVRQGIPGALRGEVWQLLSNAQQDPELMHIYPVLLTKQTSSEQIIQRDMRRTYPAHENFRPEQPNSLLDSLYKVCKAYAIYDEEVGYCQGLSFLVAALLLHMPEEQAFCVFVKIMKEYGLRNLFRSNFEELCLRFYQLDNLLRDFLPDLHTHFTKLGIEPFMYASHWFLTMYTAKFPLITVFYIMDIFLLDGMDTLFQVALGLLNISRKELLLLDFEGVLKFFRIQMPKRYKSAENVQELIEALPEINAKKLSKYAKAFNLEKEKEKLSQNKVVRLEQENIKLKENNLRLEQENDDLVRQLVANKVKLRSELDSLEDKYDSASRALKLKSQDCQAFLTAIADVEDEKMRLQIEVSQLKEVCRRELQRAESELSRDRLIIKDYKNVCSKLSERFENRTKIIAIFLQTSRNLLEKNKCDEILLKSFDDIANRLIDDLENDNINQMETTSTQDTNKNSALDEKTTAKPGAGKKNSLESENGSLQQQRLSVAGSEVSLSSQSSINSRRVGAYLYQQNNISVEDKLGQLTEHVTQLELELARTKGALVEAECRCQQLSHEMNLNVSVSSPSTSASNKVQSSHQAVKTRLDAVKAAATKRIISMVSTDKS